MANKVSTFITGAQLVITFNGIQMIHAQSLSFQESFTNQPVGGLGQMGYTNLEPLSYSARGSFQIMQVINELSLPNNLLITNDNFNPVNMLVSKTFDIIINTRQGTQTTYKVDADGKLQPTSAVTALQTKYTLKDCRLTNFSISFSPNQLAMPTVDYVCQEVQEENY